MSVDSTKISRHLVENGLNQAVADSTAGRLVSLENENTTLKVDKGCLTEKVQQRDKAIAFLIFVCCVAIVAHRRR